MEKVRERVAFLCDMDGVIYHGDELIPGVKDFVEWLTREKKRFLFLTNNSGKSPKELSQKLHRMGLDVDTSHFYTSAMATARFLSSQAPNSSAFVIGDPFLHTALYNVGISFNDVDPDYVVVGETNNYNFEGICKATRLVDKGAKLIGTNTDITTPMETGNVPACRALVSPIEIATGRKAYYVGKPNPLMMRTALHLLDSHSSDTVMIGDRMDTDIIAGIESGMDTVLVLSGVSSVETVSSYPFRPRVIIDNVGEIALK